MSGLMACPCVNGNQEVFVSVDPNGAYTATWDPIAGNWFAQPVGTFTIRTYTDPDADCTGSFVDGPDDTLRIVVQCSGENIITVSIGGVSGPLFSADPGSIGDTFLNTVSCGGPDIYFAGGQITVTLP